jgi:hypothetical protein
VGEGRGQMSIPEALHRRRTDGASGGESVEHIFGDMSTLGVRMGGRCGERTRQVGSLRAGGRDERGTEVEEWTRTVYPNFM